MASTGETTRPLARSGMLPAMRPSHLLALTLPLLVLLAGCPEVRLRDLAFKPGSLKAGKFTLAGTIEVVEPHGATEGEEGSHEPAEARGLVALYVPEGWRVPQARILVPGETAWRALVPVPQAALAVAEAFPTVPGQWWAFATGTQRIEQGQHSYGLEVDLDAGKKTKEGPLGISVGPFSDGSAAGGGTDFAAPAEYRVILKGPGTLAPLSATVGPSSGDGEKTSVY